jgi:hypothetical protein
MVDFFWVKQIYSLSTKVTEIGVPPEYTATLSRFFF